MSYKLVSGIYEIRNLANNKVYIGSAICLGGRKNQHFSNLFNNKHENSYLQKAYNKLKKIYGIDKVNEFFIFSVLEYVDNKEILVSVEQNYIDKYKNYEGVIDDRVCYNIRVLANSNIGCKYKPFSQETRNKMKESKKGNKNSIGNKSMSGKRHTEESINKMKDRIFSQETRNNMSINHVDVKGENNPNYGKESSQRKKVINLTTGEIFSSLKEASEFYNISFGNIGRCCRGIYKTVGGYNWEYII